MELGTVMLLRKGVRYSIEHAKKENVSALQEAELFVVWIEEIDDIIGSLSILFPMRKVVQASS